MPNLVSRSGIFTSTSRSDLVLLRQHLLLLRMADRTSADELLQPNLAVDLPHTLLIGFGGALAAEENVHLLECEILGLGDEEPDTFTESAERFISPN